MRTCRHTCAVSHDKEFSKGREKAIGNVSDFQFAFSWAREKAKGSDFQFAFSQAGKKQNGSDFLFAFSRADFQFAFSRAWKKQKAQTSYLSFSRAWKKQKAQTSYLSFSRAGKKQKAQTSNLLFPGPGKSKMVQTSTLLFSGPGKSKMVQTSNLLFTGPGKSKMVQTQNGSDFQFAFSRAGKKQNGQDFQPSHFHFAGCVFGWAQPSMNKRRLSQASLLRLPICFFRAREKAKWSRLSICLVKTSNQAIFILVCFWLGAALHEQETAQSGQVAQTSNLLFPGPRKSKMV